MLVALAMLITASPVQTARPDISAAIATFQAACLESGGDRTRFDSYARANGWRRGDYYLQRALNQDWASVYRADRTALRLIHYAASSRPPPGFPRPMPEQVSCEYEFLADAESWQAAILEMNVNGVKLKEATENSRSFYHGGAPDRVVRGWHLADGSMLHANYAPSSGMLELSINYFIGR